MSEREGGRSCRRERERERQKEKGERETIYAKSAKIRYCTYKK